MKSKIIKATIISVLLALQLQSCDESDNTVPNIQGSFQWNWANLLYGPSNEDEVDAVASDAQGNVYLSGKFEDSLFIEGQTDPISSNGSADIMIVKYDKSGVLQWIKHFGGIGEDNIFDAVCDEEGNVYLSGFFENTVQFGNITLMAQGEWDMVVLKLNSNGNVLWAKQYGGKGRDGGNEVEFGNNHQLIVAAQSEGTFEGIANTGNQDAYVLSLSSQDGSVNWIKSVQGPGYARAKAIAVDHQGNAYLGGDYLNSTFINSNEGTNTFDIYGGTDAYLASWTSEGTFRWVKTWGGIGNDLCKGVTVNSKNELYMVAPFENTVDIDGMEFTSAGASDLIVMKSDNSGKINWLRQISGIENLYGAELAVDREDDLVFGMSVWGMVSFESGNADSKKIIVGAERSPILVSYDLNGNFSQYLMGTVNQGDAHFGEISISNNTAYLDCEIIEGPHIFGTATFVSQNNSKDAVIVSIGL